MGTFRRARAGAGEITSSTGADPPYEEPQDAELVIPTHQLAVEESVVRAVAAVVARDVVPEARGLG